MGGYSLDGLEELYGSARKEEVGAWDILQEKAVTMLVDWILKHLDVHNLPRWQIEDIALEGFEEATCRMPHIPTWRKAWNYSRQASLHRILRLKPIKIFLNPWGQPTFDSVDPFSFRVFREIDFVDEFEAFLKTLDGETIEFILQLFDAVISGPPVLAIIAEKIGISERTLNRRICELKFIVKKRFRGESPPSDQPAGQN
jgi:hypothetical protein